jgi:murein DD-endopeptidase MepM/ murein hydrolase activator NlpD
MGPARDDGVVDPQPHPEGGDSGGGSFDPGLETGYLRRAPRDHELDPQLGAAPFDPGPERYDDRRARKQAKRRERIERKQGERPGRSPGTGAAAPVGPRLADSDSLSARDEQPLPSEPAPMALTIGNADPTDTAAPVAEPQAEAEVVELPRREPMAERFERLRVERERVELQRRAGIERERSERERAERERRERRRDERAEKLRRDREALRPARRPAAASQAQPKPTQQKAAAAKPAAARIDPGVKGPVRKRARSAENRRRVATRRRGLFWPTAKAGLAVTAALALGGALGSLLGLPVPALDQASSNQSLINSASLFGIDPGTPTGLVRGYVFPILGPHDFGDKLARFGAPRYGHIHEGQDIFGKAGTTEVAVHDGIVVDRGKNSDPDDGGRGNYLAIYSPDDNHSFVYMHMLKPPPVTLGDHVHAGQVIGQLGCTGSCEGPHLHFEVRAGKASLGADTKPLDPLPFLRQWPQSTPG